MQCASPLTVFQNIALLGGARTFSSEENNPHKNLKEVFKAAREKKNDLKLFKSLLKKKTPKEKEKIIQAYVDFLNEIQMSYIKDSAVKPE